MSKSRYHDFEYLLQQPRSLESMAIETIGKWVAFQAMLSVTMPQKQNTTQMSKKREDALSLQIKTIRNHLKRNLPMMFHDKLAMELIRSLLPYLRSKFSRMTNINKSMSRMIETLFTENLTCVVFDKEVWDHFQDSFLSESYLLTGLTQLELSRNATEDEIVAMLPTLPSLKRLALSNVCTDGILNCIVDNCKLIETLDLSKSDINDDYIYILTRMRDLRCVSLSIRAITKTGIVNLLLYCEYIEHINIYGLDDDDTGRQKALANTCDFVGLALEHIASIEENVGKKFKLKSYSSCHETTLKQLQLVVEMCPLIQKICLQKYRGSYETSQGCLKHLENLQDLRELKLSGHDFYRDRVKETLQAKGCNLVELHLESVDKVDLNALIYIYQTCVNLQSLTIETRSIFLEETSTFSCNIEIPPLIHLKKITLEGYDCEEPLEKQQIVFLLSNCPNVEFIDITRICTLTDDIILEVLEKNPKNLMHLKELRVGLGDDLSKIVIDKIIEYCTSYPQVIEDRGYYITHYIYVSR